MKRRRKSKWHDHGGRDDNELAVAIARVVELFRTRDGLSLEDASEAAHLVALSTAKELDGEFQRDAAPAVLAWVGEQCANLPPDERDAKLAKARAVLAGHRSELWRVSASRAKKHAVHAAKRRRGLH